MNKKLIVLFLVFILVSSAGVLAFNQNFNKKQESSNVTPNNVHLDEEDVSDEYKEHPGLAKLNNKTCGKLNETINKEEAIFIATLAEGNNAFSYMEINKAYLIKNGEYWKIKSGDVENNVFIVNAKTGACQKNEGRWRSFNELKAQYIAELYCDYDSEPYMKFSQITENGKKIWKVKMVYNSKDTNPEIVYFDPSTGQSKCQTNKRWQSLKEVEYMVREYEGDEYFQTHFRNLLRDLYE